MRQNWILLLVVVLIAVVVAMVSGLLGGFISGRLIPPPGARPKIADTPTVVRQVQSLSHLVSVKYLLEKVVVLEDIKWFGENRLIMVAHGVAKAGFDLSQMSAQDIQVRGTKLVIQL